MGGVVRRYVYIYLHNNYYFFRRIYTPLHVYALFLTAASLLFVHYPSARMRVARVIVVLRVCVCIYVCMCCHSYLPPHTLESQNRDTNAFIAIQRSC